MAAFKGNCVVAQSGGPTTVINSSLCGVIQTALKRKEIDRVFVARHGVLGVLNEDLLDMGNESAETIDGLKRTPAAAAGSCRYKLKDLAASHAQYERMLEVFEAHNVRYFFYIGGNDSMDTADKLGQLASEMGYPLRVMGVPKTIDNDLAVTDHCPGFGSVAKIIATCTMESGRDTEAMRVVEPCAVFETMGRNAGWIAAAAALAKRDKQDAPHLVYLPEVPFVIDQFVEDVQTCLSRYGRAFIVVSEGIKDENGEYVAAQGGAFAQDAFGHRQLGGAGMAVKELVETKVRVKCRFCIPSIWQRNCMHFASKTDVTEAYAVGREAVLQAVRGTTAKMVTLVRESNDPYRCTMGLADLSAIANGEKKVPRSWINKRGNFVTKAMIDYIRPLVAGDARIDKDELGLPVFVRFQSKPIKKRCKPWVEPE